MARRNGRTNAGAATPVEACPDSIEIARLLLRSTQASTDDRRRIADALTALCARLEAQVAAVTRIAWTDDGPRIVDVIEGGHWPDRARESYLAYLAEPAASDPFLDRFLAEALHRGGALVVRRRRELIGDADWYGSDHYRRFRGKVGFDDCVYAAMADEVAGPRRLVGVGLHRLSEKPGFDVATAASVGTFVRMMTPLLEPPSPTTAAITLSKLTSRQRDVVLGLLEGRSAKELAHMLGLRVATVHSYLKLIYKKLGVGSRGELAAMCNAQGWNVRRADPAKPGG